MDFHTLTLWGNGSVTLPKRWRDRYPTKMFLAQETHDGYLLIKPMFNEDIVFYEEPDRVGLRFPHGMSMDTFVHSLKKANARITKEENSRKKSPRRRK